MFARDLVLGVTELVSLGYDVKSHSSSLEDDQAVAAIQKIVDKRKPKAPPAPVETKSVPGKTAEEVAKEAQERLVAARMQADPRLRGHGQALAVFRIPVRLAVRRKRRLEARALGRAVVREPTNDPGRVVAAPEPRLTPPDECPDLIVGEVPILALSRRERVGAHKDALQKLCHDLLAVAHGAAPQFFMPDQLPKKPSAWKAAEWSSELSGMVRHAEHPFNAGLQIQAWAVRARQAMRPD